jgi:hypothetical protein
LILQEKVKQCSHIAAMTVNEILDFARSNAKPVSRGLSIQAAEVVSSDAGKSAFHMTTFNVLP